MFRASSCPSPGATTTAVAASGLPSELGDSSAVGRGRADQPDHDQQGLTVRGSNPGGGTCVQTGAGVHPASCTMGTGSFPGVKSGRGVTLTSHPLLVPWSWMNKAIPLLPLWDVQPVQSLSACTRVHFTLQYSYTSTPPMGRTAGTEPQCLYKGALYLTVELYLYSPYGPYDLYRVLVPVQMCTLPLLLLVSWRSASSCLCLLPRLPFLHIFSLTL